jgi:transposase
MGYSEAEDHMLMAEEAVEIRVLKRQGKSIREIARMLDVSRNTVQRYVRGEGLPRYEREARPSKLDPYKHYIDERVKAAAPDWIPATVLLRELRALGYPGGYSILKDHLATLRPVAKPEPLIQFETESKPPDAGDFATIRRGRDRLAVFIATLGWSRATYVEFVTDERLETLLGCHERAFYFFGGVPREVLYDNMRTVVTDRDRYGPGLHRRQPAGQLALASAVSPNWSESFEVRPNACSPQFSFFRAHECRARSRRIAAIVLAFIIPKF